MMVGLDTITDKEYLGRFFIVGRDASDKHNVIVYAATGRSESSRKRVLREEPDGSVKMHPSKDAPRDEGNPALLFYNAIRNSNGAYIVSNGAQTDVVVEHARLWDPDLPAAILDSAFAEPHIVKGSKGEDINLSSYEPDTNCTPRITGVVGPELAAFHIIREQDGAPIGRLINIPLIKGHGRMIATYTGQNVPNKVRIPSFIGEPLNLPFDAKTPKDIVEQVYAALGPKTGPQYLSPGLDFRVSVAGMFVELSTGKAETFIKNRYE